MSSVSRPSVMIFRPLWIPPALVAAALAGLWHAWAALPVAQGSAGGSPRTHAWPDTLAIPATNWTIVQYNGGGLTAPGAGALARRFRLAGTFLLESAGDGSATVRKAILDDFEKSSQVIVGENDDLGGARIVSIFRERVVLRDPSGETELWLSFSRQGTLGAPGTAEAGSDGETPLESYPYGVKQIGDRRWIFDRNSLLQYYKELMDEPDRLVAVFDSLKPVRAEAGNITGYRLDVEGEKEFFDTVGLKPGDVVRAVNSLPMTNRQRAEFFIREFVADNANAFAIEVERNGAMEKLIYHIR